MNSFPEDGNIQA